jgi:heat shock protein HtpX
MKRIVLFLATNLAVMLVMSVVLSALGVNRYLTANGLNFGMLLVFSLVVGFTGAFFSLLISKPMAKWSTGARVIDAPASSTELWLVNTVRMLSERAGISMPEVAVYNGEPNAFATGAFKNSALVAVSTGLLESMTKEEVEAVLGHEVAHIANGDMVTMTLIQGVVNTFVVFLARVVGYAIDKAVFRNNDERPGIGYMVTVFVCEIIFGIAASMIVAWFSRQREFRADAGSAKLLGNRQPMIHALARLGGMEPGELPKSMAAAGISDKPGWGALFSSHPPMEQRIAALQNLK